MRRKWEQIRSLVARRIRYKITRGGVLFSLAIVVVGLGAVVSANNLLFLIVAAMLSTLLVSGFVSRMCLAGLELDFQVPEHVSARRAVPGKLFVHNQKWLMPSFSIRVEGIRDPASPTLQSDVYFPLIAGGAFLEETVEVRFPARGAYRQNSFAFSTSFPFGFLEKSARVTLRRDMVVYPSIDPQPGFEDLLLGIAGEIETHYRGLGRDFYRIRPYEALESSRHVDWKASAHVGSLQVREFAREQVRIRPGVLRLPGLAAKRAGSVDSFPVQWLRVSPTRRRRHLRHSEISRLGVRAKRQCSGSTARRYQLQSGDHALTAQIQRSRLDGRALSVSRGAARS